MFFVKFNSFNQQQKYYQSKNSLKLPLENLKRITHFRKVRLHHPQVPIEQSPREPGTHCPDEVLTAWEHVHVHAKVMHG